MTDDLQASGSTPATDIAFGFNRETDEASLQMFITRFADRELLTVLLPRLNDTDIIDIVDLLSGQMKKHLSEKEYHRLFLADKGPLADSI
ncbi:MAG: hypothetical protein KKG47_13520 [Proteobacteria bacterium]|nr:hypothetical protein [Pseudomonadota bacterium]MBU1737478.1 hypothetical protein [Pseudomonadota bacterium]